MADQPQISAGAYLRLVALGALVGIPAALAAAVFLALVGATADLARGRRPVLFA